VYVPSILSRQQLRTALGECGLSWTDRGVSSVLMPGSRALDHPDLHDPAEVPAHIYAAADGIICLLDGVRTDLRFVDLDMSDVDEFRRRVYDGAREIGAGETTSYGELAKAIGSPKSAREVGTALARNPFPIVVPCHRVLAATGALHGFSAPGGIATKRRMLEIEGANGFVQQPLFVST
jgi:methylated-DNA-[protein]-cysteine S-methyltransferase